MRFLLTGGQMADVTQGPALLANLSAIGAVLADKAYDAQAVLEAIGQCGAQAVIPPKVSRLLQRSYAGICIEREPTLNAVFND